MERGTKVNTNSKDQKQRLTSAETTSAAKKPYVKPEVRHERVFETMALTCGKVQISTFTCRTQRKNS